jgi:type IV pilus assembly protein PilC
MEDEMENKRKNIHLDNADLAIFAEQLALVVQGGISLAEGVGLLLDEAGTKFGKGIMKEIFEHLEFGEPLSKALKNTGAFPIYMVQMIEIGEESGRLDAVLTSLADYYATRENFRKSVVSAITYPLIMFIILIAIVIVMIAKVLPIFNSMFLDMGTQMDSFAKGAMQIGEFINKYSVAISMVLVMIIIIIITVILMPESRRRIFQAFYKIFGSVDRTVAQGQFATGMSLMLASGIDTNRGVELVEPMIENEKVKASIARLRAKLLAGEAFTDAVVATKLLSKMQGKRLVLGFRAGILDKIMEEIGLELRHEANEKVERIISVIEPALVILLCVVLGAILLSAMLPLLGVMSALA